MVKDVGSQKTDITIWQLVAMVPSAQKELKEGLLGEITLRVNHFCSKEVMYNNYYNTQ
jgi:hypothetical protein